MDYIIAVTCRKGVLFADKVHSTRTTASQPLTPEPVDVSSSEANYAYHWAIDDAQDETELDAIIRQVWLIRNGAEVVSVTTTQP